MTMLDYHKNDLDETPPNPYQPPCEYPSKREPYKDPVVDWPGLFLVIFVLFCITMFTTLAILAGTRWL